MRQTGSVTLIVVSGAPGTGKSTIAAALAAALRWPLLSLDPIKETLGDTLGLGDEDWSNRAGEAAAEIVFRHAVSFPDAIAEGWWRGARRDRAVATFVGAAEVFCRCDPALAQRRMADRVAAGRHPIHRDMINPADVLSRGSQLAAAVKPLHLGAALVEVDTGQPGAPAKAVAVVRALVARLSAGQA
jgi:predicted kinase